MRRRVIALMLVLSAACGPTQFTNLGQAMLPTLQEGERVVATPIVATIERGDILVFPYPKDETKLFVKRVIGLPGDQIQSVSGQISINGRALVEKYVAAENRSTDSWGPLTVPADEYFVMGDNRHNSSDSRIWGTVKRQAIRAKVLRK